MKMESRFRGGLAALTALVVGASLVATPGCGGDDPAGSGTIEITDKNASEKAPEGKPGKAAARQPGR